MKRLTAIGGVLVALVAALVVAIGLEGSASAAPHRFAFTVVSHDALGSVTPADFFTTAPAQNAQASIDAPVHRGGTMVGIAETVVTVARGGDDPTAMIECSVELPEGLVVFNGSVHLAALGTGAVLPVVGGTDEYAGATGEVTLVAAPDGSSTELRFAFSTK